MENFLTKPELELVLERLKLMGYTEIRFPGGTDKNYDHYSGVVIYKYNPEKKKVYFLCVPYNPIFYKTQKEDRNRKPTEEGPRRTAIREVYEETGLIISRDDLVELTGAKFAGKKHVGDGDHIKYFFIIEKYTGIPAQFEGGNLIEAETASPLWIEGSVLAEVISKKHKKAFSEAVRNLAGKDRDLCMAMIDYLD